MQPNPRCNRRAPPENCESDKSSIQYLIRNAFRSLSCQEIHLLGPHAEPSYQRRFAFRTEFPEPHPGVAVDLRIVAGPKAQTGGMAVAMRNTQNSISLLQTADGALNEAGNVPIRMKDLATQANDASSSSADRDALQPGYDALTDELSTIVSNIAFGGATLLNTFAAGGGILGDAAGFTSQIGADSAETMHADFSAQLGQVDKLLQLAASGHVAAPDARCGCGPARPC